MKRLASIVVLMVLLAFTAQTTVVSLFPELKAFLAATSGIDEEVAEEDEPGGDDQVVLKSHSMIDGIRATLGHSRQVVGAPRKIFREILAPPPQA